MDQYLARSKYIDFDHPAVCAQAAALAKGLSHPIAIAKRCFEFARDEIKHSWDFQQNPVTCRASDVLLQYARTISVFIHTSPFAKHREGYSNQATGTLPHHTNDSFQFCRLARRLLEQIWRDGFEYNKAGVMLGDFSKTTRRQISLFEKPERDNSKIMDAIDRINTTVGNIRLTTSGGNQQWTMRRERLSPKYTTRWLDIPAVR